MPSIECSCPYCPLEAENVQCCDVILTLHKDTYDFDAPRSLQKFKDSFITICLYFKNNLKLPVGESYTTEPSTHTLTVDRLTKKKFKICFHTKKQTEEDPSPVQDMD